MHRYDRTTRLVRLALALGLLGGSGFAHALGLGKFVLHSGLDEPLSAEIEITTASQSELSSLKAGLASRAEFDNAGIDRLAHLTDIKYTIAQRADGRPVLKLTTVQPVREPFLHFLLQVEWRGGRLLREYTTLLDPPHLAAAKPAAVSPPVATPASEPAATSEPDAVSGPVTPVAPEPAPPAAPAPIAAAEEPSAPPLPTSSPSEAPGEIAQSAPVEEPLFGPPDAVATTAPAPVAESLPEPTIATAADAAPEAPAAEWASRAEYRVKAGDTLSRITRELRRDNTLSAEQVMLALLKTNKSAFFGNNVNNLKAGKILKTPSRDVVESVSRARALKDFRAQYNSWQEYKLKLASSTQMVQVASADKGASRGDIAPKPAEGGKDNAGKDLLKIVSGERDKTATKSAGGDAARSPLNERQALIDKAATLEEAITSKELENKELRERVSQLEAQIRNTKRLVELESKELAKAQKQAAESKTQPAAPAPAPTPAQVAEAPKPAVEESPAAAAKPVPASPPKRAAPPPPPPPPPAEEGIVDAILAGLSDNVLMPILGGVAAIAGGALLIYYRRRRRAVAEFGESILSGGLNLNSEGGAPTGGEAEKSADVSFLSDFSQGGMGNIHTDEVDPIAEAEVYLAYGRDEQAEEILKEAVVRDPIRHELRLKLLEIYQQRNDLRAFETVAEELYAALEGKGGAVWAKAEEMGHKMNPHNPLFRGAARGARGGPGDMLHDELSGFEGAGGLTLQGGTMTAGSAGIDLDLGGGMPGPDGGSAAGADTFGLELDFGGHDKGAGGTVSMMPDDVSGAVAEARAPAARSQSSSGIDFDFSALTAAPVGEESESDLSAGMSSSAGFDISFAAQPKPADAGEMDFGSLSLEATPVEGEAAGELSSDEVATKLDLAKAYIDMGDADGARSILDEVLAEGSDAQKKQAAELAAQIAA